MVVKIQHSHTTTYNNSCLSAIITFQLCHAFTHYTLNYQDASASMHRIYDELQVDGIIQRQKDDYAERQGQTAKPITTNEVKTHQVLHSLLWCFDHYMKFAVHLIAEVLDWTESPTSRSKPFLDAAKKRLQEKNARETNQKWDFPDKTGHGGTTTLGNTARILLDSFQDLIVAEIPERFQPVSIMESI